MPPIPIQKLHHTTVVVRDAKAMARNYAELLGIEQWKVVHHTPERLERPQAFGADVPYGYIAATGSNQNGVTFRLVQPTSGLSTFQHFLLTRGQGVHGFCSAVLRQCDLDDLIAWLAPQGISIAQITRIDGVVTGYYLDTRAALGGYYVQLIVPERDDWREALGTDEVWNFGSEFNRPEAAAPSSHRRLGGWGGGQSAITPRTSGTASRSLASIPSFSVAVELGHPLHEPCR